MEGGRRQRFCKTENRNLQVERYSNSNDTTPLFLSWVKKRGQNMCELSTILDRQCRNKATRKGTIIALTMQHLLHHGATVKSTVARCGHCLKPLCFTSAPSTPCLVLHPLAVAPYKDSPLHSHVATAPPSTPLKIKRQMDKPSAHTFMSPKAINALHLQLCCVHMCAAL